VASEKFAVSFESRLAALVRAQAKAEGHSVSGWLADAAARKLRRVAAREMLAEYEAEHGQITEQELAEIRSEWPV
jgi:hypothetical protein